MQLRISTGIAVLAAACCLMAPSASAAAGSKRASASTTVARSSHAWLSVSLGHPSGWVGQPIPITVSAQFKGVEGVTLEGVPQLQSDGIFTTDLARDPRQATQIINGEPVLVASWTGTITPSTAGPLGLSVELPVRIRYHEAVAQPTARAQQFAPDDPFQSMQAMMNMDPTNPNSIQQIFQSMQQSMSRGFDAPMVGRAHDEALTLKANSRSLDIKELPDAGRPPGFSGAVGRFDLHAAIPDSTLHASEPVTLTVVVHGKGDLDRVTLGGVTSSADWKAYPMSAKSDPSATGKLAQKTFEQVIIPTHGGELTIPPVELAAFDPITSRYSIVASSPIPVLVDGPPAALSAEPPTANAANAANAAQSVAPVAPVAELPAPASASLVDGWRSIGLRLSPILGLLLVSVLLRFRTKKGVEKTLHQQLERAAKDGSSSGFFTAAQRLIVVHFARRWQLPESAVTAEVLRQHLGESGEPLVSAMLTADALRFGRRDLEPIELGALRSTIEASLRSSP